MSEGFSFVDKRGLRTSNLQSEMTQLRNSGMTAKLQPKSVAGVDNKANNTEAREFVRRRAENAKFTRTASNIQIALPKTREPGQSLVDKGIPHDVDNPEELKKLWSICRMYYSTHDLIPLLVDIYSKFPMIGLEFQCKDELLEDFYSDMFLNQLQYEEFLPEGLGREYFTVGEVTSLAHFDESLGIWESEEIIPPERLLVTKSMFVGRERVQLMVKELVEGLRDGPRNSSLKETPSQEKERKYQYEQLVRHYPEFIQAAAQDDGLDLSDALVSRIVNRAFTKDLRGTPHMLRSLRTLMVEESIHAAQDAVADRMYSPLILAKLGLPDLGNGEGPWLPGSEELEAVRDDLQAAMAADFKLMVGNVGLDIQSVFGREILPRFEEDYQRIDAKIMQAWGIGEALIAGGTSNGGSYASSALNREFASQLMLGFQKKVTEHIRKRCEVIAEAQEHYDYELKGGIRRPIYREIVRVDPETGEKEIVRVPKLLIPDIKWKSLNLRDEAQVREFLGMLRQAGAPISDETFAVNIDIDFKEELERQSRETVEKQMAQAQAFDKVKRLCDEQAIAYPPELAQYLQATLALRGAIAQTEMAEGQEKMMEAQTKQMMPAGQMGLLPGTSPQPGVAMPGSPEVGAPQASSPGGPPPEGPPGAGGPEGAPPSGPGPSELPRNRARPAESDEARANMPRAAGKFAAPSSYGAHKYATTKDAERAVRRLEVIATRKHEGMPRVAELVADNNFYVALNLQGSEEDLQQGFVDIEAGKESPSAHRLHEALTQYQEIFAVEPVWD